jgi:transcriptional regulator with XRE-family HTH domain
MSSISRGYSTLFIRKVEEADRGDLVSQYAYACIDRNLPMSEVARRMDVTRATIYNWFTGKATPRAHQQEKIRKALARWQRRA